MKQTTFNTDYSYLADSFHNDLRSERELVNTGDVRIGYISLVLTLILIACILL